MATEKELRRVDRFHHIRAPFNLTRIIISFMKSHKLLDELEQKLAELEALKNAVKDFFEYIDRDGNPCHLSCSHATCELHTLLKSIEDLVN